MTLSIFSKIQLHSKNKHQGRYNFEQLIKSCPSLESHVIKGKSEELTIDFFNPKAVKLLNTALLKHFYQIEYWDIPAGYLCPPIPGRSDYIHYIQEFLSRKSIQDTFHCLDIGTGANCIYPILGSRLYNWTFVASDIDSIAVDSANKIIMSNVNLSGNIIIRQQENSKNYFKGIVENKDHFDISICNPPFHDSLKTAQKSNLKKLRKLKKEKVTKPALNFSGQHNELFCPGGEVAFVKQMFEESKSFKQNISWFSVLISKNEHLKQILRLLKRDKSTQIEIIEMKQGHKISRILLWRFKTRNL